MKKMLCGLVLLLFLCGTCSAAEVRDAQSDGLNLDALQNAAGEYGGTMDLADGISLDSGLQGLLDTGSGQIFGVVRKAVKSGVLLLCVVLLCGLAQGAGGVGGGKTMEGASIAGALAIAAISVSDVHSLIGMGKVAIENMGAFSKILLPTMAAASAAGGAPGGAAARQLATMLFSDVLMTVISGALLPLVYAYIAASTAQAALGNEGLKRIASLLKWTVTAVLTAIVAVFVGYLTVSGVIAGSTDAVAIKAAKLAMSGAVPVVGGILSDAAETVLAGAGILRNAVGVFGMIAILGMCLLPFLQLAIHYLV
ncbi:MAG: stage III sporulation protein AE [Oscillospiraceae bacterium]